MSDMSDYLENKLIDHLYRGIFYTPPGTLYFALFTSSPNDAGGGTEVSGGSYARAAVTPSASAFLSTNGATSGASTGTGGQTNNTAVITFPAAPTANWGTVTHMGIFDAATGGNLLTSKALTTPKTINSGDPAPSFAAGAFTFTLA